MVVIEFTATHTINGVDDSVGVSIAYGLTGASILLRELFMLVIYYPEQDSRECR
ncbi:hypothetical protein A8U91_00484 [Halomonas elongata]|uniref:Uncharacterized protein n=1 Tax=Halomonas elongata TaxID=2746 RepID=A0A1B8P1L3_HALEL|nr:hypothetical protein [Halomonas elongata]OBX36147.1 hypothetical protein A8U91_00484 [Halomonas elongata]